MSRTLRMEMLEKVSRRVRVVPVVAAIVHGNEIAGLFGDGARILYQVVAGKQDLEDGIAKGVILFLHVGGRGNAAGQYRLGNSWQKGRLPALVSRRFRHVRPLEEGPPFGG